MKVIVLIGLPGTGKSTLGRKISTIRGYQYISTGDIARELVDKSWQDKGELAPEDYIRMRFMEEVSKAKESNTRGLVIDGLPRTIEQVYFISSLFPSIQYIVLDAPHEVLMYRLYERGRTDDTKRVIKKRIEDADNSIVEIQNHITRFLPYNIRQDSLFTLNTGRVDVNVLIDKLLEVV